MYVCMIHTHTHTHTHTCMYVSHLHTCYVLIQSTHTIYYVLAAVFGSCFYVLFKFRFVREGTQGGTLVTSLKWLFPKNSYQLLTTFDPRGDPYIHTCFFAILSVFCPHYTLQVALFFSLRRVFCALPSMARARTHTHFMRSSTSDRPTIHTET